MLKDSNIYLFLGQHEDLQEIYDGPCLKNDSLSCEDRRLGEPAPCADCPWWFEVPLIKPEEKEGGKNNE